MSRLQSTLCRSAPWRVVSRRAVLPWSLQGYEPSGAVLEIGAGSGAMAAEVLAHHPNVRMTVTDYDAAMVDAARKRLARFDDRVSLRPADATALPFADGSFDAVLSWVMLHHTVAWEQALAEAVRVLRPGGSLVGYDLLSTPLLRWLHREHDDRLRLVEIDDLRAAVRALPVEDEHIGPTFGRLLVRFHLRKR